MRRLGLLALVPLLLVACSSSNGGLGGSSGAPDPTRFGGYRVDNPCEGQPAEQYRGAFRHDGFVCSDQFGVSYSLEGDDLWFEADTLVFFTVVRDQRGWDFERPSFVSSIEQQKMVEGEPFGGDIFVAGSLFDGLLDLGASPAEAAVLCNAAVDDARQLDVFVDEGSLCRSRIPGGVPAELLPGPTTIAERVVQDYDLGPYESDRAAVDAFRTVMTAGSPDNLYGLVGCSESDVDAGRCDGLTSLGGSSTIDLLFQDPIEVCDDPLSRCAFVGPTGVNIIAFLDEIDGDWYLNIAPVDSASDWEALYLELRPQGSAEGGAVDEESTPATGEAAVAAPPPTTDDIEEQIRLDAICMAARAHMENGDLGAARSAEQQMVAEGMHLAGGRCDDVYNDLVAFLAGGSSTCEQPASGRNRVCDSEGRVAVTEVSDFEFVLEAWNGSEWVDMGFRFDLDITDPAYELRQLGYGEALAQDLCSGFEPAYGAVFCS